MGRGISEFKKGAKEVTDPINEVKNEISSNVVEKGQTDEAAKQ